MGQTCSRSFLFVLVAALWAASALSESDSGQVVELSSSLQVPEAVLSPGTYKFSVEDRLSDRVIVRVTAKAGDPHYLLLAVPNPKLRQIASSELLTFKAGGSDRKALRAWACPGCKSPLEFVYPKLEAVKLATSAAEPVLAVDPSYDKLPETLSADDMKVVTMWLVSPKRIMSDKVEGVEAAKLADARPQSFNAELAENRTRLPKTASQNYALGLAGICLMCLSLLIYTWKRYSSKPNLWKPNPGKPAGAARIAGWISRHGAL